MLRDIVFVYIVSHHPSVAMYDYILEILILKALEGKCLGKVTVS